ncbi:hypothetical protein TVAG_040430 [Trichomonas vaginalis G3]|uniref:Cyclin, N-terminal domain containing protein n=1 Tax=Trichomonas vaginalis (strain ATCC PRA-98 / G3) TaxID=412133 RepID=A2F1T8_TRIV3|nr:cyclin-like family [Trichomonas vaginalis G3]EAY01138.1 hypothetical protein TVAG_040430 [Trichomonas vaginalis G3]KAI5540523.1 cyclin-like family [Trichomonas vaginalis G3]|eukprot:XP_001313990.1 hypothetical protein [Trichomonas vaginalis G3]
MTEGKILYPRERVWTEKTSEVAWTIVTFSRRNLGLSVSPCVASSFLYLHYYYEKTEKTPYPNYMLLTTSLFLATKVYDYYRPIDLIFQEIAKTSIAITKHIPQKFVQLVMGNRDFNDTKLSDAEKNMIAEIEICLLNAIKWDFNMDLSFYYLTKFGNLFEGLNYDEKVVSNITDSIIRDLCLCTRSPSMLHLNQETIAVASIIHSFGEYELTPQIKQWVENRRASNEELVAKLIEYMIVQSKGCAKVK